MVTVVKIQRRHCWSNASPRWRRCFWLLKLPNLSKLSLTFPYFPQLSLTLLYASFFFDHLVSFAPLRCMLRLHIECSACWDLLILLVRLRVSWKSGNSKHPAGVWSVRRHRWLSGLICHLVECLVFFSFFAPCNFLWYQAAWSGRA